MRRTRDSVTSRDHAERSEKAASDSGTRSSSADLRALAGNRAVQQLLRPAARETLPQPPQSDASLGDGHPLSPELQAEMGQRLGADLSSVRVHEDSAAAASARAHGALAYTLGDHIVFSSGRFSPGSTEGRSLLAHELVHTMQQSRQPEPRIQRQPDPNLMDVDIEPVSPADAEQLRSTGTTLPTVGGATWSAVGGTPYQSLYPDYKQSGDTCGAASLVDALLIWDRAHWDAAQPNSRLVDACNLIISELERHGIEAALRWATARPLPPCAGDADCNRQAWGRQVGTFESDLARIRNAARAPGARVPEADFQELGLVLYFLWNQGHGSGLGSSEISSIQRSLGLAATGPGSSTSIQDFDSIFSNSIIAGLAPDEMAQVFWFTVPSGRQHAFIVGRQANGKWFLADQGPGVHFETDTLADLHTVVRTACLSNSYWLYAGTTADYIARTNILPGYTGVQRLAGMGGTHQAASNVILAGSVLGQVDNGILTIGDDITVGRFIGTEYSLAAAEGMLPSGAGGGVVVEMPSGVFSIYATTAVSEANLDETSLDASDSANMLLGGAPSYHHAWLILGNRFGIRRNWWQVY